jgi:uncharacterized membrane protein
VISGLVDSVSRRTMREPVRTTSCRSSLALSLAAAASAARVVVAKLAEIAAMTLARMSQGVMWTGDALVALAVLVINTPCNAVAFYCFVRTAATRPFEMGCETTACPYESLVLADAPRRQTNHHGTARS